VIEINDTGTKLRYKPGMITGGAGIEHDCGKTRGIGWFLEGLLCLVPFAKVPVAIQLKGLTNEETGLSVDYLRTVTLPLLKHFGLSEGLELRVVKRGARPGGGGEVVFRAPVVKALKPINLVHVGQVRRVRGVAFAAKVSPQVPNRLVDAAKGVLLKVLPDVYVYTDHLRGDKAGNSSGFGVSLVAETTNGSLFGAEASAQPGQAPEEVGLSAAKLLLHEVGNGGTVDSANQGLVLTLAALCPEDVSRVRLGKLTPQTIRLLRLLRDVFGVVFKIRADAETKTLLLSCMGIGYRNMAKSIA
jgi:RNA 3'-terminal phosphate cyclase-like protein